MHALSRAEKICLEIVNVRAFRILQAGTCMCFNRQGLNSRSYPCESRWHGEYSCNINPGSLCPDLQVFILKGAARRQEPPPALITWKTESYSGHAISGTAFLHCQMSWMFQLAVRCRRKAEVSIQPNWTLFLDCAGANGWVAGQHGPVPAARGSCCHSRQPDT